MYKFEKCSFSLFLKRLIENVLVCVLPNWNKKFESA